MTIGGALLLIAVGAVLRYAIVDRADDVNFYALGGILIWVGVIGLIIGIVLALVAVAALAMAGAVLALRLEPSAGTGTLVSPSSETSRATERFKRDFGDDPVVVLVKGDLRRTVLTADLARLIRLEGCLSGNVPRRFAAALPPPCRELQELRPAKVVFGPGTFINTSVNRILEEYTLRQRRAARETDRVGSSARRASAKLGDPPALQRAKERDARRLAQQKFTQ